MFLYSYGSSYLNFSCLVQIGLSGVWQCPTPTILWHHRQQPDEALCRWTAWLRPEEGSLRLFERTASPCLLPVSSCCTSAGTSTGLRRGLGRGEVNKPNYSFTSLMAESWETVFLTRRAVSRAAELAYQHSLISLPITRMAWKIRRETVSLKYSFIHTLT